jgi:two-component system chemotaxis sensor kinase CheA
LVVHGSPTAGHQYVIVFRAAGRELGLLAPQLEDIRQLPIDIDAQTFREPGVAGAFVVDGATVRLLDLPELAELAEPEWFGQAASEDFADATVEPQKSKNLRRAEQHALLAGANP